MLRYLRVLARHPLLSALLIGTLSLAAEARDIHVNHQQGDDARTGESSDVAASNGPVKTIARALKLAQPGDVVHLTKLDQPYRESAVFHNRHGEAERPIVLDGHGATITGIEPVDLSKWEQPQPGLYRNAKLIAANEAIVDRWFFRMNGRINRMSRCSKGPSQPLKAVADLQPGEWTFDKAEQAFYIRLDPQQPVDAMTIEAPLRSSGVQISGDCSHLLIRRLQTTHVHNDGFNIHGKCRDVRFEEVSAIECGDDGISAHDDCRISVDGFTSIANATGFCHTNDSHSDSRNVTIRDCIGFDVFVLNGGQHRLSHAKISSSAAQSISVHGDRKKNEVCRLHLDHVRIERQPDCKNPYIRCYENSIVRADGCEFLGFHFVVTGQSLFLRNSIIGGESLGKYTRPELNIGPEVKWFAARNRYDISHLRFGNQTYGPEQFAAYQSARQQDVGSTIGAGSPDAPSTPEYVHVLRGHLPLIVSAPHGGTLDVPNVTVRKTEGLPTGGAGFVILRDVNTDKLASQIVEAVEDRFWRTPHLVLSRTHRKFVDMNRPVHIAYEHADMKPIYDSYHAALTAACQSVQKEFGRGLLIDVHGQSAARDTVFRGTHDGKTVTLLRERFGADAHNGESSLFGLLKQQGWKVYPDPLTEPEQSGFRGGYIVQTYGSHTAFGIDAMQLEFGGEYSGNSARAKTATDFGAAFDEYFKRYLGTEK